MVRNRASLVSAGTERMLLEFGRSSLLGKVRKQPAKVRQVLQKIQTDGLLPTLEAVQRKLDEPIPLGYSACGEVIEVGAGISDLKVGDLVASAAPHADLALVPRNLVAKVPPGLDAEAAAFTVLGAIALQGVRLLQPTLGERFLVSGLGLIGLVSCQLLRAHGCKVLGLDFDVDRLALARSFGAETFDLNQADGLQAAVDAFTEARGVDGALIAAATTSNDPVSQAARSCRKRGRIVLVGVTGLTLDRAEFYEKELTFQVSCSYGPGRYDPTYEQRGQDYPFGFVRWTERRNFEAVLELLADGGLDAGSLVTHRVPFSEAQRAYDTLEQDRRALGIVLEYGAPPAPAPLSRTLDLTPETPARDVLGVALVGAGNYATATLLPALAACDDVRRRVICTASGVSGTLAARNFGFERSTTDLEAVFADDAVDAVWILTRHDSHADLAARAVAAGKHVFVEKPLATTPEGLATIRRALEDRSANHPTPMLTVGFNRRFSPQVQTMRRLLAPVRAPKAISVFVNAGAIPADHWTQDPVAGGGRWIGEGCHFVDLARFLVGAPIASGETRALPGPSGAPSQELLVATLAFSDGSLATIQYLANGHKSFPKERVEVLCDGKVLVLDNFRALHGLGWSGFDREKLWRQDKGHAACLRGFVDAARGKSPPPISMDELFEVSEWTLRTDPRFSPSSDPPAVASTDGPT